MITGWPPHFIKIYFDCSGKPLDYFLQEQPVFGVSCDPLNDNIFSVAGDDGRILIYDMRDSSNGTFHSVLNVESPSK